MSAEHVVTRYFDALARRDLDAMAACWAEGGEEHIAGQADVVGPEGVRGYFGELFGAFPDFALTVRQTVAEAERMAVHWTATGTFAGPGTFNGLEPTGDRVELEGIDLLRVEGERIVRNDAVTDGATLARQLGMLPPQGSSVEDTMTRAFNARTRVSRRMHVGEAEKVADRVWLVRGGFPVKTMNVYLIEEDGGGVCLFDAGIADMAHGLAATGAAMGGITRIVLGHAHADHRGAAPALDAPVFCHPDDRADAEGDGGDHYFDLSKLRWPGPFVFRRMLDRWDGGPVSIAGTLEEGDEVAAGFRVVHLPGHAPGQIGLYREHDGVALTSDCFYTLDPQTTRKGPPRLPHEAFNLDEDLARASIDKLAAIGPAAAWPGHADPLLSDVAAQLEQAAHG
jgi:glyoxylase-like metal-dependent hydrolase (beta-lactamase superfamily II)/predicted ester cyclase